jgi:peptidoglycan-N-acetylglucosamine deacetylase
MTPLPRLAVAIVSAPFVIGAIVTRLASPGAGKLRGREVNLATPLDLADRELLLTFDDGPANWTRLCLFTLGLFNVTAIFFLIGLHIQQLPRTPRVVKRRRHLVGSHTATHPEMRDLPEASAKREIDDGHIAVQIALAPAGADPLFRFPYLHDTPALRASVEQSGLRIVDVDVVAYDWEHTTARETLERTLREVDAVGRGVVLLHDLHFHTARMLPSLLVALHRRGYTVVTPVMRS